MARDENAVMYAVEQVCGLYGVQVTREQSRTFNVQGAAGRWRPLFVGSWTDHFGKVHRQGRADFLARPKIRVWRDSIITKSVPLWIECKSADGKQTPHQAAFQYWVERNGDDYLLLREDVRPLIAWFEEHGVTKNCDDADVRAVVDPVASTDLYVLPCKYCGELKNDHIGPAFGCKLQKGKRPRTWSPNLKARPE
jgi:hypothetical protein